jgi:hypothetical protein
MSKGVLRPSRYHRDGKREGSKGGRRRGCHRNILRIRCQKILIGGSPRGGAGVSRGAISIISKGSKRRI